MNRDQNNITDEMLVKYLLGEASETEQQQVQAWLAQSHENKNRYNDFKLIWNQSRNIPAHSTVNENEAWMRFKERTQQNRPVPEVITVSHSYKWLRIAAILLLFAGGSTLTWFFTKQSNSQIASKQSTINTTVPAVSSPGNNTAPATAGNNVTAQVSDTSREVNITDKKENGTPQKAIAINQRIGFHKKNNAEGQDNEKTSKEFICNSTPSPFEICIVQKMKCHNSKQPATISTCSTLEPDQSGRLRYKAFDKMNKKCAFTIEEITIKRISTGETVVLTADSKPSTAQDLFNYLTGRKKGAIVAHSDCDNYTNADGITIDNNFGDLRLQ